MTTPTIDFQGVADRANLRALVESELGPPDRSRKYRCPFHDDHNPSLALSPDGRRFKCWSGRCGKSGTALDWVMLRDNLGIVEAARKLDPYLADAEGRRPEPATPRPAPAPRVVEPRPQPWRSPEWQAAADRIVRRAEANLWSPEGWRARDWLRARRIADATARRFRLGFLPEDLDSGPVAALADRDGRPRSLWARRGITLPWLAPGACYPDEIDVAGPRWVGVNVRRLALDVFAPLPEGSPKCQALAGSVRGHAYPFPSIDPSQAGPPGYIVEGEFDALLAHQEAGHLVHALTVGGANQNPDRSALLALAWCPVWLLGLDHDEAGVEGAWRWLERAPHKGRRVLLPHGKDLTDFAVAGGDVAGWIGDELTRLNLNPKDESR